jgi:hypothetical protein
MLKDIPIRRLEEVITTANTLGIERACTMHNVSAQTIKRYDRELQKRNNRNYSGKQDRIELDIRTKDTINQTIISTKKFASTEELATFCDIDLDVWEAAKIVTNQWNTSADFVSWQFKVEWRKISGITPELFAKALKKHADTYTCKTLPEYTATIGDVTLEVNIPDLHLGRLVSQNMHKTYTMELAHDVYIDAQRYFHDRHKHMNIDTVILMIGSDFMNVDNTTQSTTHGTGQLEESTYMDSFDMAIKTAVDAIEFWRSTEVAVEVKIVSGNHDKQRMYALGCVLVAQYRTINTVHIDNSPMPRKYFVYGINLIGFTHGKEDYKRLKSVYQIEMREHLSACTNVEFHCGHTHQEKVVEDFGSVIIRTVPSLAQDSLWEIEGAYRGNRRAQAFAWHKTQGLYSITYYTPDFTSID